MDLNLKSDKPLPSAFLFRYGVALGATGLAALVNWLLPWALTPARYLGFYPAVVVSAALGGLGPGLVATFASLLLVNFVFGSFNIYDRGAMMRQVIWVVASIGVSLLAEMQRRAGHRAEEEADSAHAAEEALSRAAAEWEQTFNSVPDLIAVLDPKNRIVRANRAMAERLGVTAEECRGAICYRLVHGADAPPDFCPQVQAVALRRECVAEVHEPRLGGDFIISCTPLFDAGGELTGTVHVSRDITERKRAEAALKKAHDELEVRVQERTAEIVSVNEKLGAEIAERKHAEETATRERQRLYDVLETLPVYVVLLTPDYHVPFANRFFRERFGESHGRRCFEYLFGREEPCEICETYTVMKTDAPHHWEWTGPDGRNYNVYDFPFIDADGSPLIMEMGIDITEIKKADDAVKAERKRLFDVLETLPTMIFLLTPDYRVPFANKSFRDRFGESQGRRCYEYCFGKSEPCDSCQTLNVLKTGKPQYWEITNPDGSIISVNSYPFTDVDGSPLILEMKIDITERRRAIARILQQNKISNAINRVFQEALSCESEEMLCKKCLAIAEGLAGSRFGIIAELNPAGRLDTIALSDPGWSACRMAKTDAVLSLRDLPVRGLFGGVIREGKSAIINDPETAPERAGTPEGHPPITSLLEVPLMQAGKTIGLIALANKEGGYDASDLEATEVLAMAIVEALMRLRAEMGVRRMNMELEQRVHERTADLEAANRELEAFAYSVSHDLRTPLRTIDGFSRLLEEDCGDRLDAEGKDSLNRILASTGRMGRLIDDLLNLSRITRAEMRRGRVDLSEHAAVIAAGLKEAQPERQVEFIIAGDVVANGDENLLAVVLENLIGNAWKFTEKTPVARIEFGAARLDDGMAYFVRDNGAGFDMAYAGKLFNPFERLHSVEQFPGTGIGLATVKRIVNRHGGRVWAEGAVDKGAAIYFTLSE